MNHLLDYYKEQNKILMEKVSSLQKEMDVEELHDLRVTLKRMRTFFRMLDKTAPALLPSEEDYKAIRSFFKTAGTLRDLHVQDREMSKYEESLGIDLEFIHAYIKELEQEKEQKVNALLSQFDFSIFDRYEKHLAEQLKKKEIYEWFKMLLNFTDDRMKKAEKRIDQANTTEQLHKVRSRLKDLMYYLEIINSDPNLNTISIDEVKDSQSFLGDWHDFVVSREFLHQYKKQHPEIAEKNRGTLEILEDYLVQKIHFK